MPHKTISIGNITVGGTGKTPAAIAIAQEARRRGFYPVILTRGYKGKAEGPCFVTTGDRSLLTPAEAGDEPVFMAEKLQGVPIVKGSNRYESGLFAIQHIGSRDSDRDRRFLFILDDGFQHWSVHRDKDVVLIDRNNPFGNGKLLPIGRLREPLNALARADVLVLTGSAVVNDKENSEHDTLVRDVRKHNTSAPIYTALRTPVSLRFQSGDKRALSWISGRRVLGFCAIGSPASFKETLASTGADVRAFLPFGDHHRYTARDVRKIKRETKKCGADWIVTTEKDMIKIRELDLPGNILIIEIELSFPMSFYEEIFQF